MFYNIAPLLHIFHEYDTYFMSMKFNSAEGKKTIFLKIVVLLPSTLWELKQQSYLLPCHPMSQGEFSSFCLIH